MNRIEVFFDEFDQILDPLQKAQLVVQTENLRKIRSSFALNKRKQNPFNLMDIVGQDELKQHEFTQQQISALQQQQQLQAQPLAFMPPQQMQGQQLSFLPPQLQQHQPPQSLLSTLGFSSAQPFNLSLFQQQTLNLPKNQ